MISLNYLKYLFDSKKYLLIFVSILEVLTICVTRENSALILLFSICIVLSFVIPLDIFKYIHDRKAIDSYFCLPISRKQLLYTGLLFSCLTVTFFFSVGYIIINILNANLSFNTLIYLLAILLGFICLIVFNVLLYQVGNSMLDGVIMIGSYSALPLVIYCVLGFFFESFVCGFQSVTLDFEIYFSPLYMLITNFGNAIEKISHISYLFLIAQGIITIVSLVLLHFSFINRKVERASSPSKELFAYPLVTNLYAFLLVLGTACTYDYSYSSIFDFLSENAVIILIIFALYVCSHFVYKRNFYFDIKMPAIFIGILVLCFGFVFIARANNGFDLSLTYNKDNINKYEYYCYELNDGLREDILDLIQEDSDFLSINVTVNIDGEYKIDKEVSEIFENLRNEGINDFYSGIDIENGQLYTYNDYTVYNDRVYYSDEYFYRLNSQLTFNDMLKLVKYDYVTVYIDADKCGYMLNEDGTLSKILSELDIAYDESF